MVTLKQPYLCGNTLDLFAYAPYENYVRAVRRERSHRTPSTQTLYGAPLTYLDIDHQFSYVFIRSNTLSYPLLLMSPRAVKMPV